MTTPMSSSPPPPFHPHAHARLLHLTHIGKTGRACRSTAFQDGSTSCTNVLSLCLPHHHHHVSLTPPPPVPVPYTAIHRPAAIPAAMAHHAHQHQPPITLDAIAAIRYVLFRSSFPSLYLSFQPAYPPIPAPSLNFQVLRGSNRVEH